MKSLFSSVQFSCSVISDLLQPHGLQHSRLPCPSPTPRACWNSWPLTQWCHPTISSSVPLLLPPSIFPSIRVLSVLHIRWPKYWSCSFSIIPSSEYSGLISFRIDWFDLAVQGAHKSLLYYRLILFFQNVFTHWDISDVKRGFFWCEKGIGKALNWCIESGIFNFINFKIFFGAFKCYIKVEK